MKDKTKSRVYLILIFTVFFGPLLFATWLFFVPNTWLNSRTQNHGTLVQPVLPLDGFKIINKNGETWDKTTFMNKWTLVYIGEETCDLYCEASLFKMRQVRLTLGRDSKRVARKFIVIDNNGDKNNINEILKNYSQMQSSWFNSSDVQNALSNYKLEKNHIYLIDPLGNLMMRYTKDATSKGMKKDLKRLLKVSKIG